MSKTEQELEKNITMLQNERDFLLGKKQDWKWLNENRVSIFAKYSKNKKINSICFSNKEVVAWSNRDYNWNIYDHSRFQGDTGDQRVRSTEDRYLHIGIMYIDDLLRRKTDFSEAERELNESSSKIATSSESNVPQVHG